MTLPEHAGEERKHSGALLHNLLLFGRLLRRLGMDVNPGRMIDLVEALSFINIGNRSDFYYSLRGLLVNHKEHLPLFDRAFELFWQKHEAEMLGLDIFDNARRPVTAEPQLVHRTPDQSEDARQQEDPSDDDLQELIEVVQTYSRQEQLRVKDFGTLTEEEMESVRRFMSQMVWQLGQKRTRRFHPGSSPRLDLRRLMRRNLRYGGELLELPSRKRKMKPRPLVIIADVSGSMQNYTRLLLHFVYSLVEGVSQKVEAFVFSTRLSRITRALHERELDRALEQVARSVPDWSGGTRIGDALQVFNFQWARRVLGNGAIVILISDGWDRGDPDLLSQEMARLQRACYRLIWLNPLLGSPRYEPLTRGMQAALPHVDDFLPVHNLASLEDLALHLEQIDEIQVRRRSLSRAAFSSSRSR